MLKSSLCDYSDAYILVGGTIKLMEYELMIMENGYMKEIKEKYLRIGSHSLTP